MVGINDLTPVGCYAHGLGLNAAFIEALIGLSSSLFAGRFWNYLPVDVRYHDLQHTAQAAMCLLALGEGQRRTQPAPSPIVTWNSAWPPWCCTIPAS